ncbi:MAG TPA: hypothetical protein VFV94_15410, partial [Polyangiaceae bacterium]|nr:hypothetical protein [Polyangiaceae bacterium]
AGASAAGASAGAGASSSGGAAGNAGAGGAAGAYTSCPPSMSQNAPCSGSFVCDYQTTCTACGCCSSTLACRDGKLAFLGSSDGCVQQCGSAGGGMSGRGGAGGMSGATGNTPGGEGGAPS